ncbi:MAG: hypothetical protein K2I10_08080 [Lachnospiraceae bacterium]|nr:hypothetical protein [Lachnospiraceae bacterium]
MRWNREVDRAIVSGISEKEIQQIKKEYITDRIKESFDIFASQPERYGFNTGHNFSKAYATVKKTYTYYQDKANKWEESYGKKSQNYQKESVHERLLKTQKEKMSNRTSKHNSQKNDRGAR